MQKLNQIRTATVDICKKLWIWLQVSQKNKLIAVCIFIVVITGLILFVRFVLPPLFLIVLVYFLSRPDQYQESSPTQNKQLPYLNGVYKLLMCWAFIVIIRLHKVEALPSVVRKPAGASEIIGKPPTCTFCGIPAFRFDIPLKPNNEDIHIDLNDTKEVLQTGFINALEESVLPDQPYTDKPDGMSFPVVYIDGEPLIVIADITRETSKLVVTAFWVNNSKMARMVKNWRRRSASNRLDGDVDVTDTNY